MSPKESGDDTSDAPPSLRDGPESFRRVFDHYAPRLRAFMRRRGASTVVCEELVQEVLLTVWSKRASFDRTRGSLSAWVFTIARNRLLDQLRRVRPEPDREDPLWVEAIPANLPNPELDVEQQRRRERLQRALLSLPEDLRALVVALYCEGSTMSELSTETNVPLGTVKTRARRALAALRSALAEDDER